MPNTSPPSIALVSGYAGLYAGCKLHATVGVWTGGAVTGKWQTDGADIPGATSVDYFLDFNTENTSVTYLETQTATGLTAVSNALKRPALINLITDVSPHTPPTGESRIAYNTPTADPTFGPIRKRITDSNAQILGMTAGFLWGDQIRHCYMRFQCQNFGETTIWIEGNGSGYSGNIFLDGQTYVPSLCQSRPSGWKEARWHDSDPNQMVYCTDTQIRTHNPFANTNALLHDFSPTYYNVTFGNFEGEQSRDADYWPISALRHPDDHEMAFVYRRSTDQILCVVDVTGFKSFSDGSNTISPNGTYMTIVYNDESYRVYNIATGALVTTATELQKPSHYAMALNNNGDEMIVGGDRSAGAGGASHVIKRRLSDGTSSEITTHSFTYHTSAANHDRNDNDWISTDYWPDSDNTNHIYVNEIIVPSMNGAVQGRLCHIQKGTTIAYEREPHTSISRSGKRCFFKSDWRGTVGTSIDVYVVDWRAYRLAGIESSVITQIVNITCTTTSALIKAIGKKINVTATSAVTAIKNIGKKINATATSTQTAVKNVGKKVTTNNVVSTTTASGLKAIGRVVDITCTTSMSLVKNIAKKINITCTKIFSITTSPNSVLPIFYNQIVDIIATSNVSIGKNLTHRIDIVATSTVQVTKSIFKVIFTFGNNIAFALDILDWIGGTSASRSILASELEANKMQKWPNKDPQETLDYDIDWAGTAAQPGRSYGDTITNSLWYIDPDTDDGGLVVGNSFYSANATKIWLSGGTINKQYKITNRIVTLGGRTMEKSGYLRIKEK